MWTRSRWRRGGSPVRCVVRFKVDDPTRAWTLLTALEELAGFEVPIGERRSSGSNFSRVFNGPNWLDTREREQQYDEVFRQSRDFIMRRGSTLVVNVGPVWGLDDEGEMRNMWQRTAQDGMWFTAGSLAQCRIYSAYLALQIKAIEEGLMSKSRPSDEPPGAIRPHDLSPASAVRLP